jgi:Uncharacterised nucleotidyltransferase
MSCTNATPEIAFLIACTKSVLLPSGPRSPVWSAPAGQRLDGQRLLRAAAWHSVTPLLASAAAALPSDAVPVCVVDELAQYREFSTLRAFLLASETVRVQSMLAAAGIPTLAWKGSALALTLYGDLGLREATDLDVLVRTQDLERAEQVLHPGGYTRPRSRWREAEVSFWESCTRDIKLLHSQGNVLLELHDAFMNRSFPRWQSVEQCLERRVSITLCGKPVDTLDHADLLVSLCAHGMTHGWERLKWIADIAAFLLRYEEQIDWQHFLRQCRQQGCDLAVLLGIGLARDLLQVEIPKPFQAPLERAAHLARLRQEIVARLLSGEMRLLKGWTLAHICAATMRRPLERTRYLASRLLQLTDEDLDYCSLPASLFYLRYPLRAWRLLEERVHSGRELAARQV